jgi:cadmium resistance protein CadD (predicted permease)
MFLEYFLLGAFLKAIAGFDDTVTRIPIIARLTRTRQGKIAFSLGTLMAMSVSVTLSILLATFLEFIPFTKELTALLIFALAFLVYFDVFVSKPREKTKTFAMKKISSKRFRKLVAIGFVVSMATLLDDTLVYVPLFLSSWIYWPFAIAGIFFTSLVQVLVAIYFSKRIAKMPYKKELAVAGLLAIGLLTLAGLI